jgi:L-alanine-DL-glutamate epimerase-like enolase superfamily enzyme
MARESDMHRRAFLGGAALAGLAATPLAAQIGPAARGPRGLLRFADDALLVDFHAALNRPLRLASAEILVVGERKHQFIRVRSTDGDEGVIKANSRMEEVTSLFHQIAVPAFSNVDLRDLSGIIAGVYRAQYKFAGLAFWTAIGHLELAVWDMLGKAANWRCAELMGPVLREEIPIYVSSLDRRSTPERRSLKPARRAARSRRAGG